MSSARDLGESLFTMARLVGSWVEELKDWNCCGASPAHSVNQDYATLLAGRNILLAEQQGINDLHVICPSCFVRLRTAEQTLRTNDEKNALLESALGHRYKGSVRIKFFLELLSEGITAFQKAVINPLSGLRGVLYFGCLLTRPQWITGFDVRPYEDNLVKLVQSLGVETLDWGLSKQCCGSHLAVTKADYVNDMVDRIRDHAIRAGANCIIAFCPLCQVNMELRGKETEPLPVFYISELIGLASRIHRSEHWLKKHLANPIPLLKELDLL
ncbi:MAG: heterodisulfide reductase subunit B [Deltaproteobacteria bacterium]|nr:MAG: heterodisulfide reductase subunit B [Deltaproteobacteria bacterium]